MEALYLIMLPKVPEFGIKNISSSELLMRDLQEQMSMKSPLTLATLHTLCERATRVLTLTYSHAI